MAENSKIEWTDHTINFWVGCEKVSPGCAHCYAERDMTRKPLWENCWGDPETTDRRKTKTWGNLRKWNKRAEENKKKEKVFVMSLGDFFEENQTLINWRLQALHLMEECTNLNFLFLTKRVKFATEFMIDRYNGNWPRNFWFGFTAEDQQRFDERWYYARHIVANAPGIFVSFEPLLEHIVLPAEFVTEGRCQLWGIVGGESGPKARIMPGQSATHLMNQLFRFNIPAFFKQWGEWYPVEGTSKIIETIQQPQKVVDKMLHVRLGRKHAGSMIFGREFKEFPRGLK